VTDSSLSAAPAVDTLIGATEAALAAKPQSRTLVIDHGGQRYVAKRLAERPRRLTQTLFMRWLVKQITGQPLPLRTLALSEAASSMDYEAQRLQALAAAGVCVPRIAHKSSGYLLLEHRGAVVASLLEKWPADTWRSELPRMARELGEFHAAGFWHGGAQIKNVTLQDGIYTRIDFEENFGEFLPLAVTQATDLLLFLNSISLAGPVDETESRQLLPVLIAAYTQAHPDNAAIRDTLRRAMPWFRRIVRLERPFRRFTRKSYLRMVILTDTLEAFLHQA
jgi:tRNA A-37 threonylcarbamoyl transferase component Bud32